MTVNFKNGEGKDINLLVRNITFILKMKTQRHRAIKMSICNPISSQWYKLEKILCLKFLKGWLNKMIIRSRYVFRFTIH